MALDERLRRELERAARPADPSGVYEHLIRRRERRRIAKRLQAGALTLVVIAGSIGGFYVLSRVFREGAPKEPAAPSVSNGLIVFSRDVPGEGVHLFAVSPDGSDVRELTPDGRAVYRSPDASPDGRTVVVAHEIPGFDPGQAVLATVPIDGGSPTWLTEETWHILDPAWSPDGGRIAFAGSPGGPFGIYIFDIETGDVRLVPGTDQISVGHPTWSPDGSRVAFGASVNSATIPDERWDIFSVDLDGNGLINLTNTPDERETWPTWSWSTDRIAFVEGGPAEGALLTMASSGGDVISAYSGELAPANPVWSPDGTMIAFEAGSEGIFIAGADGAGPLIVRNIEGAEPSWQPVLEGISVVPSPSPNVSPSPQVGQDIGLGFPVCDVTSVSGVFAPGVDGTAFVATRTGDTGGCPEYGAGFQLVAVDVSGDGLADASYGPLECEAWCSAFAAPDVDGDGTNELLIQNVQFSIAGLRLYEVRADPAEVFPVTASSPGPQGELPPGAEPQFWIGGDGFELDTLRCFETGATGPGRVLIQTSASQVPPDSRDSVWRATATWFDLNPDGTVSVVDVGTFEEPVDEDITFAQGNGVCGARLPYPYGEG